MKPFLSCFVTLLALVSAAFAQPPAEQELIAFQQKLDDAVVATDLTFLQNAFTPDFYFKHGTGSIDNKESWLKAVEKNRGGYLSRQHSSVEVDLHGDIGITRGNLRVTRKDQVYVLDYVRAYRRQDGRWQLLSHRTVHEEHLPTGGEIAPARINHLAFYVLDLKTSTDFYQQLLGLRTIPEPFRDGRHTWFEVGPKTHLHIISGATAKLPKEKRNHLCFTVDSVDAFVVRLNERKIAFEDLAGTKSTVTTRADGVKQIYFQDPDDNWIEINDARQ